MRPPPPPYLPWLDGVGGSRAGPRSGAGDIDQQESAFSLAFGDVTVWEVAVSGTNKPTRPTLQTRRSSQTPLGSRF